MTLNSKEENSEDFCLDFVQELGLWVRLQSGRSVRRCGQARTRLACSSGFDAVHFKCYLPGHFF